MAQGIGNPTRMELARQKGRLKTARRGHKLLRDKRDELMRCILLQTQEARELRTAAEKLLAEVSDAMACAMAALPPEFTLGALLDDGEKTEVRVEQESRMGVALPRFSVSQRGSLPCGMPQTSAALDLALEKMAQALPVLLALAQAEKAVQCMALELETTRRRVNALEYILIPELEENIRRIGMKLEETERGNIVRLMKVKDLVLQDAMTRRRGET